MSSKKSLFLSLFLLLTPLYFFAQDTIRPDSLYRNKPLVEDDPVVLMLDSLANLKIFEDAEFPHSDQYQNWNTYSDMDIPVFPDSVYRERIAQMNDQSPFEFVYNSEVRKFIEVYAFKKRKLTARIMGLAQIYFPLFEEQLDRHNMPLELKYLAVIESALNPVANSRAGAKGLWQFMYGTGKVYGLKVSSYVDDRFDPYKATIAACEHLGDLYDIYGNWALALAAYNSGAGNVNKAIRRSGGLKNFWALHNYLPRETRSYVPAFIAASYVLTYANEHKIYPVDPGILYYEVDTVTVRNPLSFEQISEMLNIPMDEVAFLNPSFKHRFIPATPENPYKVRLRKKYVGAFINNETALYAYKTRNVSAQDSLMAMAFSNFREADLYTVKSGESLTSIAKKFHMTVAEIKALNGLRKNYVKPKQKILVYTKPPRELPKSSTTASTSTGAGTTMASNDTTRQSPTSTNASPSEEVNSASSAQNTEAPKSIHVVRSGESLGSIANKYHCTVQQLKSWNDLSGDKITVGQKLKVNGAIARSEKPKTTSSGKTTTSSSQKYIYYTIQSGDNLWDIADKFDVTVAQLKKSNDIKNTSRLKPGQKIKIPR
ncbi:MAG TPA: LysM peptidoglycan-binding domain-containing protein [Bacteroidales bacterium]|mgnify:CR=1 FL=1|nr:LysM peptidoglycan-binding domain-containing protein [Bacteroidales bacterium]HPT08796.1 LysM peptidoglycan-binding domain-containing protein [Bacteroidales bacterium]